MLFYGLLLTIIGVLYSHFKGQGVGMNVLSVGRRTPLQTFLFLGLEMPHYAFGIPVVVALWMFYCGSVGFFTMIIIALTWPLSLAITALCMVVQSQTYGEASEGIAEQITKRQDELLTWNDKAFKETWRGKKIPIEIANEAFQDQLIDYKDVLTTFRARHDIFKMSLTQGHIQSFLVDLMARLWKHDSDADKADISDVYNRGNDFYGWFLDEKMLYSMGYFDDSEEKDLDEKCSKA
jgi:sphingolipid C9-methyltransferase